MEVELERLAQKNGPITAADIARAVDPLREQRAARIVVIESALEASRRRRPSEGSLPDTNRAHISLVPTYMGTKISRGTPSEACTQLSETARATYPSLVDENHAQSGRGQAPLDGQDTPVVLSELWADFRRSFRGVSGELIRRTKRFSLRKSRELREVIARFPRVATALGLACTVLVLMAMAYGSGYQSGFQSGATVVSGPIHVSLKDVPVCQMTVD